METVNCVRCGKPAKFWGGHVDYFKSIQITSKRNRGFGVKQVRKSVLAGWCSKRCYNDMGFSGWYHPWMGELKGKIPHECTNLFKPLHGDKSRCRRSNWPRFRFSMGVILFSEGIVLGLVGGGLFSLAFLAMGMYVILSRRWK